MPPGGPDGSRYLGSCQCQDAERYCAGDSQAREEWEGAVYRPIDRTGNLEKYVHGIVLDVRAWLALFTLIENTNQTLKERKVNGATYQVEAMWLRGARAALVPDAGDSLRQVSVIGQRKKMRSD